MVDEKISGLGPAGSLQATDLGVIESADGNSYKYTFAALLSFIVTNTGSVTMSNVNAAISNAINNLVASAPGALDTLKELADALGDDPNFATTVTNLIAGRELLANKATDLTSNDDTKYPSVKAVVTAIQTAVAGITLTYTRSSPATRNVGGINIGDSLTGLGWDVLFEKILAPYTAPTISNTVLTPSVSNFNQQNVTYNATFRWVQNVGTPAFVSAQVQYRRGSSGSWTNLTTSVATVNSTTKDASASVTVNTSGVDNTQIQFQCVFVDGQSNTSTPATATFAAYGTPTVTGISVGSTSHEHGDMSSTFVATINRVSPNVPLVSYQPQYQVNGGSWNNIGSPVSASGATQAVSFTHNDTSLYAANSIGYRILVADAITSAVASAVATVNFYYREWWGSVAALPSSSADVRAISNTQLTVAGNSMAIATGTTNVNFVIILPPGKSLASVIDTGNLNLDVKPDYVAHTNTISVNDFGGNAVSYTMYAKIQSVAYNPGTTHQITTA